VQPRVLHIVDHTGSGGAQVVVQYLIRELKDAFSFDVAVLGESGQFSEAYAALGVPVFELDCHRWSLLPLRKLIKIIRCERYDLIQTHLLKSHILGIIAAKCTGRKVIVHDHSGINPQSLKEMVSLSSPLLRFGYQTAYRSILSHSDGVVVLSPAMLQAYQKNYRVDTQRIKVLPNAVDVHQFLQVPDHYQARSRREELGLSNHTMLVAMAGRLVPEKDWLTFLKVARQVQQALQNPCAFLVIGSGPQEDMLKDLARDLELEHVHFLGYRNDLPELLHMVDVFLLTSRREGFPIVLLEAMAAGCPVVATRTSGAESIITHGVDGLLAEVGDAQGLTNHVTRLLHDARQTVSDYYTLEVFSARMCDIYREVLEL
jgi:glycosyltransferase involved in cell wall biosynthesis